MSTNAAAAATTPFSSAASSTTLTREQRLTRFVNDDLTTFAMASAANTALFCAKEFHNARAPRRLEHALVRTRAVLPVIAFASALGVAGMKLTIAVVTHTREDYTRSSVVLAFPVAGALLRMHAGPRAMALGALGFGALGFGADQFFAHWHRRNASLLESRAATEEEKRQRPELLHYDDGHHESLHASARFLESRARE